MINYNLVDKLEEIENNLKYQMVQLLFNAKEVIRNKNIFLLLDDTERKIVNMFDKDMNTISKSLLQICKNVNIFLLISFITFIDTEPKYHCTY